MNLPRNFLKNMWPEIVAEIMKTNFPVIMHLIHLTSTQKHLKKNIQWSIYMYSVQCTCNYCT